jgi:hypothetical protein
MTATAAVAVCMLLGSADGSESFTCLPGSTTSGGRVDATVTFSLFGGSILVKLENSLWNPTADSQLISGVSFDVTGATGSGSLLCNASGSGGISYIATGGSYTTPTVDSLSRWRATESGLTINLTTLSGGTPNRLIIGPDDAGSFTQAGRFSSANTSITGVHEPSVLGWATFSISIPGVSANSTIDNVQMLFGTMVDTANVVTLHPVPEPATNALLLLPLGLRLLQFLRRRCIPGTDR